MSIDLDRIEAIEKETRTFTCPCCDADLQFIVGVIVRQVRIAGEPPPPKEPEIIETEEDRAIAEFKSSGVLDAFIQACEWVSNWSKPSDLSKYFLTFMRNAQKVSESTIKLRAFVPEECKGRLEAYTFANITMVLENGEYRMFLPTEIYKKQPAKRLFAEGGQIIRKEIDSKQWAKTKYGYVAGHVFASALALESRGAYGRATGTQRT